MDSVREPGPDFTDQERCKSETKEGDHFQMTVKEEERDADFIDRDLNQSRLREDYYRVVVKEEVQDSGLDQDHHHRHVKEENQDPDFTVQDCYKIIIKEEDQDPDSADEDQCSHRGQDHNQDPNHWTEDPAGPSDPEVSHIRDGTAKNKSLTLFPVR